MTSRAGFLGNWINLTKYGKGLYSEVASPCLPYLKQRVDSNYEEISRVMVARAVGFLVGALGGGLLCDRLPNYCYLWFTLAQLLAAVGCVLVPFCPSLPSLACMFFMDGFGKGILCSGSSSVILRIWKENAAPPTHALHMGFGVGALIVPQIARPFLPREDAHKDSILMNGNSTANASSQYITSIVTDNPESGNLTSPTESLQLQNPPIEIPFAIVAVLTGLVGLWFLVLFFCDKRVGVNNYVETPTTEMREEKKKKENKSLLTQCFSSEPDKLMWIAFVSVLCIYWIFPTGAERAYGRFIYAYTLEGPHKLSVDSSTIVETMFWATFTGSRLIATFLSIWVPAAVLIFGNLILGTVVSIVLAFISEKDALLLWIFNCAFGIALAPLLPASIAWADRYIQMTAMMTSLAFIASAAGAFIFSWLSGSLYEGSGPPSLMHLMCATFVLCTVFFMILFFLGRKKGTRKYEKECTKVGGDIKEQEMQIFNTSQA